MSKLHSDLLDQKLAVWPNNQCFYRHLSLGLDASQSENPRYPTVWEWWEVPGLRSGCACGNMHVRIHMCKHVYVCTHIPLGHRARKLSWKNYRPEAGGGKLMRSQAALWYLRLLTMSALNAVHCLTNFLCPVPFMLLSCKQTLETWLALQTFRHLECFFIFFLKPTLSSLTYWKAKKEQFSQISVCPWLDLNMGCGIICQSNTWQRETGITWVWDVSDDNFFFTLLQLFKTTQICCDL